MNTGGVQPALTQEYLAAILSGMAGNAQAAQPQQNLPLLSEIVTPQNIVPLLEDESVKKRLGELIEHMPQDHQAEAAQQVKLAFTCALKTHKPCQNVSCGSELAKLLCLLRESRRSK